jgi:hypothetical protein
MRPNSNPSKPKNRNQSKTQVDPIFFIRFLFGLIQSSFEALSKFDFVFFLFVWMVWFGNKGIGFFLVLVPLLATSIYSFLKRRGSYNALRSEAQLFNTMDMPLQIRNGLFDLIGNTPLIELQSLSKATGCRILVVLISLRLKISISI